MTFATRYFERFSSFDYTIPEPPHEQLGLIVIIPCYNEPDIHTTLQSLAACAMPPCHTEVIVVVNHGENTDERIVEINEATYNDLHIYKNEFDSNNCTLHILYAPNLSKKHAGVGLARKITMDEAVRRFSYNNNPHGIIASLDADSVVAQTYLQEIYTYFTTHTSCTVAPIYFEHPLSGSLPLYQYSAIAQYELYLRWYVYALRSIGFPFAYHTVGSSFAVRADAYCRQGGMNKRQAGEDFYFLQKMYEAEHVGCITSTTVCPSARVSSRVPFGTGYAMQTLMNSSDKTYFCYNRSSFIPLQHVFKTIPLLYKCNNETIASIYKSYHYSIREYVCIEVFTHKINEIQKHSSSLEQCTKRFFLWFNGFMIFKYLNFAHVTHFIKVPIVESAAEFLSIQTDDVFVLLQKYRDIDKHIF